MKKSLIIVHPNFDRVWPFAADHFHKLWRSESEVEFIRVDHDDQRRLGEIASERSGIFRIATFGISVTIDCLKNFRDLKEATFQGNYSGNLDQSARKEITDLGIDLYGHTSEGFWGQTVSEYGLALTLCGLRRIPQLHREIIENRDPWNYEPPDRIGRPSSRGHQFGDDPNFTSGTIAGKRVRIVGAGNIGSRYASFVKMLGADVAIWDPFASEPCFHRAGARREWHLDRLVKDAEIFAPMVPLTESTHGIVTADLIDALPKGCLVVLVTRAMICDMTAIRRRVLADEISLAADVWDREPLPIGDDLLGRHNVVHTPHNAGRTIYANRSWAKMLADQFRPIY